MQGCAHRLPVMLDVYVAYKEQKELSNGESSLDELKMMIRKKKVSGKELNLQKTWTKLQLDIYFLRKSARCNHYWIKLVILVMET